MSFVGKKQGNGFFFLHKRETLLFTVDPTF